MMGGGSEMVKSTPELNRLPPNHAVPYSVEPNKTSPARGAAPSVELNCLSVVKPLPSMFILKAMPAPDVPPPDVHPDSVVPQNARLPIGPLPPIRPNCLSTVKSLPSVFILKMMPSPPYGPIPPESVVP